MFSIKDIKRILDSVENFREEMVKFMLDFIPLKGIGPDNGGEGEAEKASFIEDFLSREGLDFGKYPSPDERVPSGERPNIVVRYQGNSSRTLWIVSHMDIVPPGDLSAWNSDPFKPVIRDGKIYGRGTEDDGQGIVSSLFALKVLKDLEITPDLSLGIALVSDEETGSLHGIEHLLNSGVFDEEDMVLVPDAGNSEGTMIEVAEKGILWLKFTVKGKQTHASMPHLGVNARRLGARLTIDVDELLHSRFDLTDDMFDPPRSTFEPTKVEANVENVNTVPGKDVFYFDCRVLPSYSLDDVISAVGELKSKYDFDLEVIARGEPSSTDPNAEIVRRIKEAVRISRNKVARPMGIGGGTCAAHFRRRGIQAAVWMTTDDTAHQPNEYCVIRNLVEDAKVMALLPVLEI